MTILSEEEITAIVGWASKPEYEKYCAVAAAAAQACAKICRKNSQRYVNWPATAAVSEWCAVKIEKEAGK